MEDEYELVPMNPIRRMERRMEKIEKGGAATEMVKELIEVVRTNQQIVDDIVKINSDMINRVSTMSTSVQQMTEKLNEFMNRLEVVGTANEEHTENNDEVIKRLEKMEKRLNSLILSSSRRRVVPQPQKRMPPAPF